MKQGQLSAVVGGMLGGFVATQSFAAYIQPGLYRLHNHPDGQIAPPHYGLRLDELFNLTGGQDRFTFDFDHPSAAMYLQYQGNLVRIFGFAFGGLDAGSGYDLDPARTSLVSIDFTYSTVAAVNDDDDLIVTTLSATNSGTITWMDTGEVIPLYDTASADGFTFRFGDEDHDFGHRGFTGLSGWGWLAHHDPFPYVPASDWLFTAELIPAPPALAALGVLLLAGRRRSRAG